MSINVAVTGQVFSGKTTVCNLMKLYKFKVYNTDEIAHKILKYKKIKKMIYDVFGNVFINGEVDRKKLSKKVFRNKENWKKLNQMIHPEVVRNVEKLMSKNDGDKVFEVPLLFEAKMEKMFDFIVFIKAKYDLRKKIAKERGFDEREVKKRQRFLLGDKIKEKRSDFIIRNYSDLGNLKKDVEKIVKQIKKRRENYAKDK